MIFNLLSVQPTDNPYGWDRWELNIDAPGPITT